MFKELDPLLHSELRLAIMSILMNVEETDFLYLKEQCNASAGNLSIQLDKLQKANYLKIVKGFIGKKTRTTCKISQTGEKAFENYVECLASYIVKK